MMADRRAYRSQAEAGRQLSRLDLNRRTFVGVGALALGGVIPRRVYGQPSTPAPSATAETSPVVADAIDEVELQRLSLLLTGVDALPEGGLTPLAQLISAEREQVTAFRELAGLADIDASGRLTGVSDGARELADNIIAFWYTGMFDGLPAPDREERFAGLLAWQTVPYTTLLTVCKNFGYWAQEVPTTFE
jgi:hypothetical protein